MSELVQALPELQVQQQGPAKKSMRAPRQVFAHLLQAPNPLLLQRLIEEKCSHLDTSARNLQRRNLLSE